MSQGFTQPLPIPVPISKGGTGLTATTINQLLYSSAANTIAGLATGNNSVLVTSAGGVPSLSTTLPSGLTIPSPIITTGIYDSNGNLIIGLTATGSAVNNFQIANNIATGSPVLSAVGSDTNIGIQIDGKGSSGVYIKGQTTGTTAAGYRGEVISSTVLAASAVSYTTTTSRNITSIALTAGSWIVMGAVAFTGSSSVQTQVNAWCSLTSATIPDVALRSGEASAAQTQFNFPTAPLVVNATGATTVYLSGNTVFATGTVTGCGIIVAIRL